MSVLLEESTASDYESEDDNSKQNNYCLNAIINILIKYCMSTNNEAVLHNT